MKINKQAVQNKQRAAKTCALDRSIREQDRRVYKVKKKRLQDRLYPLAR